MQNLKELYETLVSSKEFKDSKSCLCSIFIMSEPKSITTTPVQFSFFNKETGKISSYTIDNNTITRAEEDEHFNKEGELNKLDLDDVKTGFNEAYEKANDFLRQNQEIPEKVIIILQQDAVPVWNITFTTSAFNLITMRISAQTGEVLEKSIGSLLSFGKGI